MSRGEGLGVKEKESGVEEKNIEQRRRIMSRGEGSGVEEKDWEQRRRIGSRGEGLDYRGRDAYLDNKCILYI